MLFIFIKSFFNHIVFYMSIIDVFDVNNKLAFYISTQEKLIS